MNYFWASVVLLTISFLCEVYFRVVRARRNTSRTTFVDTSTQENMVKFVMMLWGVSVLLYGLEIYPYTVTASVPNWLRNVGLVGMLFATPLSIWIHRSLGKHFSQNLQIFAGHVVVQQGPYRFVRHPMYATFIFFAVSTCVATTSVAMMAITSVCIILLLRRIAREERMLVDHLGDLYRAYMNETGTLLPRWRF